MGATSMAARQVDAVGGEAVDHRAERLAQHGFAAVLKRKPRAAVRRPRPAATSLRMPWVATSRAEM